MTRKEAGSSSAEQPDALLIYPWVIDPIWNTATNWIGNESTTHGYYKPASSLPLRRAIPENLAIL